VAVALALTAVPATAAVGVLDSRGNHSRPEIHLDAAGGAVIATVIARPDGPVRALSVVDRPGPAGRWSVPVRFAAQGATRHLVARNRRGALALAWRAPEGISVAVRSGPGRPWRSPRRMAGPEAVGLLGLAVAGSGAVEVVWRDGAGLRSSRLARAAGSWTAGPAQPLPRDAEPTRAALGPRGTAVAAWRLPDTDAVVAAVRRGPLAPWAAAAVGAGPAAPRIALGASGVAALAWADGAGIPRVAFSAPGGPWTVRAQQGRAASAPTVAVSRRGAILAQWDAVGAVGGAYRPARGGWLATAAAWGGGFLLDRSAVFVDPARERLREGILPDGRPLEPAASLTTVGVDDRGDVSALLRRGADLALLTRRAGPAAPWRYAAVAGLDGAEPVAAANLRGDVVVSFLSPSEFVPGDRNAAVMTASPGLGIRAPFAVRPAARLPLRLSLPASGRASVEIRRTGAARGRQLRRLGLKRGSRSVAVRAPRARGAYEVRVRLRTGAGHVYRGRRVIRVI
jgi:hypothetical protein